MNPSPKPPTSTVEAAPAPRVLSRAWLVSDTPRTRNQARAGQAYRTWRRLARHPLAALGLLPIVAMAVLALAANRLGLQDPSAQELTQRLLPPSASHWFGTDPYGRDIFARVVHGARPTLSIVALVLATSVPFGLVVGALAGFAGGITDKFLMRISDVFMAFPRLILALAVAAALGAGISTAVVAIALTGWPAYARIARAEAVVLRRAEFMDAARALGASPLRMLLRHVLPLTVPSAIVRAALDAPGIILITAGLGFLGLSLPPPAPEWGAMVADGRNVIFDQWWVSALPGLGILVLSLSFNLFGDALRDVFDTHTR